MSEKAKILRQGKPVGELCCTTGELTSQDAALNELWVHWQNAGFNMLGPPPEEPPPGVLADAVYNIRPGPGNMGLVVIELENHGYRLQFEETPTADMPTPSGGDFPNGQRAFYSPPADRGLAAYKRWIREITASVGGATVDDPVKDSEEVWRRDWRDFWDRVDAATRQQQL